MTLANQTVLNVKRFFIVFLTIGFLFACVQIKRDYIVKENSLHSSSAPAWIFQSRAYKIDPSSETRQHRYFVSDAQNENQRLCLKLAEINATKKIAVDTAQEIIKRFEAKTKTKSDMTQTKSLLEKTIQINLYDVTVAGEYWEKRDYRKEMGAKKDHTVYKCDTVVKIKKSALIKAIEAYKAKAQKELKKTMKSAIDSYIATLKAEK